MHTCAEAQALGQCSRSSERRGGLTRQSRPFTMPGTLSSGLGGSYSRMPSSHASGPLGGGGGAGPGMRGLLHVCIGAARRTQQPLLMLSPEVQAASQMHCGSRTRQRVMCRGRRERSNLGGGADRACSYLRCATWTTHTRTRTRRCPSTCWRRRASRARARAATWCARSPAGSRPSRWRRGAHVCMFAVL